jgi:hypothetical protein
VLGRHEAEFRYCESCDFIFARSPTWLDEAYSDAIVRTDTDIVVRNVLTAVRLAALLTFGFGDKGNALYSDAAGGYGLLTRLMRDLGFDFRWTDPYASNLFARGFEYSPDLGACRAVSAIEVLEHTLNPLTFIRDTLTSHGADTLLFTTQVFADGRPPQAKEWSYFSLDSGQHIAFFSTTGLRKLAERLNLQYHSLGRIHLFTARPVSIRRLRWASNRLLVLPLALLAARRLGSKRGSDQTLLKARAAAR